ncbi:MAG: hypothetical protein ACTJLM_05200 [Ehrlichia sp.]
MFLAMQAGPEFVRLFNEHSLNRGKFQQGVNWQVVDREGHGVLYHAIVGAYDGSSDGQIELCNLVFDRKEFPCCVSTKNAQHGNIFHQVFKECKLVDGNQLRVQLLLDKLNDFEDETSIWNASLSPKALLNEKNHDGETPFHLFVKHNIGSVLFKEDTQGSVYNFDQLFRNCDLLKCDVNGESVINLAVKKRKSSTHPICT